MKRIILALMLIGSIGYTANRITNSDIASNAAIAFSKLAPLTSGSVLVGNGSNVATAVGLSGDVTLASSGAVTISNGAVALATDVTGTLPVANGGTGQTSYTDGQILIGNSTGNTLNKGNIIAGSGITVTNGSGSITISASAGGGGGFPGVNSFAVQTDDSTVCSSDPCTINQQFSSDGLNDAVTSLSRTSTGVYAINIKGSFCNTIPVCTVATGNLGFIRADGGSTTTQPINTWNSGGSAADATKIQAVCYCDAP